MKILEVENVVFSYNDAEILKGVSFSLEKGSLLSMLGANGSGKTTLLKIICGVLPFSEGRIKIVGKCLSEISRIELAKMRAFVPSEVHIPYNFSVLDIVLMGRSPHLKWWQAYGRKDREFVLDILESLKLSHLALRSINSLSSGEKQMALIAQALAQEPEILVLDEPTSHLDIKYKIEIFRLLDRMRKTNSLSIIMATHDISLALKYSSSSLFLAKGSNMYFGNMKEALATGIIERAYNLEQKVSEFI